MLGLIISNGPGTISAQGAKGAVFADGPETPERVQINKAMIGSMTHTGFAHGGNGDEGIQFLVEQFAGTDLKGRRRSQPWSRSRRHEQTICLGICCRRKRPVKAWVMGYATFLVLTILYSRAR